MTSISNIKIGKKIALVLGAIVLILAALSGLALWGISANQKQAVLMIQRLTKARLAERVSGDTAAVALNLGRMVVEKKAPQDLMDRVVERKKSRLEAIEEFKRLADTPTSIKHSADMAELVDSAGAASKKAIEQLSASRFGDAERSFKSYAVMSDAISAKAQEASKFQDARVIEGEKTSKETASTVWMAACSRWPERYSGASSWSAASRRRSLAWSPIWVRLPGATCHTTLRPNIRRGVTKSARWRAPSKA
jgi:CHASE3 domain sensor protein